MDRDWSKLAMLAQQADCTLAEVGLIVIDHGSRREESNSLLIEAARQMQSSGPVQIVEPAHMELAEPSIGTAFQRCVDRGARLVIISPFFLSPGRHWNEDIPQLVADAARHHTEVRYLIAAPLAPHPLLLELLWRRIEELA